MKDIKTIHARINYATPRLPSIRHYFASKMAVQKSGATDSLPEVIRVRIKDV